MNRPALTAAALIVIGGALTSCSASPTTPALNPETAEVSALALKEDEAQREKLKQTATVIDVYPWDNDGYAVLVETNGTNADGDYSNWHAYAFSRAGDGWSLDTDNYVSADFKPEDQPEVATCMALVDSFSERESCQARK